MAADSDYLDRSVRDLMIKPEYCDQKFAFSVKADRMKAERRMVHPTEEEDVPGDAKGIYNENTGETFVYHYDTQKGVGVKYNYSRGFIRSTDKTKVNNNLASRSVPCYEYYQQFFEVRDNFNRFLHDASYPHKRGGNGRKVTRGRTTTS